MEKKEDNEWRRKKPTSEEEGRQRMEKKEDNEWRRRKTTNGEERRQCVEKKELFGINAGKMSLVFAPGYLEIQLKHSLILYQRAYISKR